MLPRRKFFGLSVVAAISAFIGRLFSGRRNLKPPVVPDTNWAIGTPKDTPDVFSVRVFYPGEFHFSLNDPPKDGDPNLSLDRAWWINFKTMKPWKYRQGEWRELDRIDTPLPIDGIPSSMTVKEWVEDAHTEALKNHRSYEDVIRDDFIENLPPINKDKNVT